MRGDVEKRAIDYGHALDLLLKAVQQSPQDRAALFNLAIAYEKLRLLDEAADTWQKLLALPADGWSAEARTRLESVEKLRRARQKAEGAVMQDPAAFIAHRSAGFRPERYFEIFWMYWLPQAAMRADAHQACAMVAAELEARNGDTSLRDALAAVRPGKVSQALAQLAETMIDIRAGRSDDALPIARSALPVLEANGQFTAAARLRAEMVYIDRVQQRYADCLRDADLDSARIRRFTYPYIAAQLQLEHGSCISISDLGAARAEFSIAERSLADHQLWRQRLRATGFIIDGDGFTGNHQIVWQNAVSGLDVFWKSDASLFQAEQLQAEMEGSAAALGWYHAAAAIYAAAVHSVALAGNRSLEATCRIDRSRLLEKIGDTAGEMREVEAAERLFRSLPNGPETAYRFTFGRLRRAEAEIDNGHPAQALAALNAVSPAAVPPNIRANMEQARGLAYFAQSDLSAAAPCFEHAVALGGPSGSHQGLAQVRLLQGSVSAALAAWQGSLPDFPNAAADTPTLLLALALLPRGLAVFSKVGSSVHARMVSAPVDEVERTCSRFVRLCSSPDSDERELHAVGRRIYQWLLAPELEGFGPGGLVFMQADGWIAALPFAAFTPRGYFIEQVEGRSPPALRAGQPLLSESPALLVSVPSARAPGGARLPFLSAAQGETADLRASLSRAALLTGDSASPEALRAALPHAAIFHFAGHGWSDAGNGALVLAPGADGEARYLTAHEIAAQDWSGCRLAVLSACLTAAGELRGPINNHSLVRALLRAGAQQVVAAKWSISSEATRPLMKEFYSQLSRGVSAPEALNRAELSLSSQERWGHPYYWAAFEVFSR
jgi:CHAT domain-containing protein/tetratricopeptide (TPR) repeat protein